MKSLRVPGTTIAITLLPGFVEVRDKGLVKKKIPVRNRSFDEVLEDLEIFFNARGKKLPPGILVDTLIKIGVPRAKRIITQATVQEPEVKQEPAIPTPPLDLTPEEPAVESRKSVIEEKEIHKESIPRAEESHRKVDIKPGETITITEKDMPDIEEALSTVEALSDSFMAAHEITPSVNSKPQIRISVGGTDAIEASDASTASDPSLAEKEADEKEEPIDDEVIEAPEIELLTESPPVELITSVEFKESEEGIPTEDAIEEFVAETEIAVEKDTESDISVQGSVSLEETTSERVRPTPAHAVKPLVTAKAVILGEDGVGKHSLQEKADLKVETDDNDEELLFIRSNIIQLADFRVNLQVWSFDDAATMRIPRKEFYRDVDIIIVVYAVSDRWSFESVDFWLREAMVKNQETPPIVIVGNKKDIREAGDPDPLEPAVTSEEGFKFAEALSKRLGTENKLHPVAFIETSCLTGEGTIDVFKTASEFYTAML